MLTKKNNTYQTFSKLGLLGRECQTCNALDIVLIRCNNIILFVNLATSCLLLILKMPSHYRRTACIIHRIRHRLCSRTDRTIQIRPSHCINNTWSNFWTPFDRSTMNQLALRHQSPHSDYVTRCYFNVLSREVITVGSLLRHTLYACKQLRAFKAAVCEGKFGQKHPYKNKKLHVGLCT